MFIVPSYAPHAHLEEKLHLNLKIVIFSVTMGQRIGYRAADGFVAGMWHRMRDSCDMKD